MKPKELYKELTEIAKDLGVKIRKGDGKFRSGLCMVNDAPVIVINKTTPVEGAVSVIAKGLAALEINNIFIKPAVRDYIESEVEQSLQEKDFEFEVSY
jgi:hypothetical protein